jgi:predicted PP-loop superfamily ATPase
LFEFFCRKGEDSENFHHNFYNGLHHSCGRCNLDIRLKTSKEASDTIKDVNKRLLVSADALSDL